MKFKRLLSAMLAVFMLVGVCMTGIYVAAEEELPFTDVKKNWSYNTIKYVYETGLMNGTGNGTTFSPNDNLTRGMVVTVLYRHAGSPAADFKNVFLDVAAGKYYSVAAVWAYENGIVNGTGTDEWGDPYFSPDNKITRQELATMFKRYADFMHVDTTKGLADISKYPDNTKVAGWATDAVKWAVGVGLITGKGNGDTATLSPKDNASRAEFATIIARYDESSSDFSYLLAYEAPVLKNSYTEPEYPLVTDADIYVSVDGDDNNPGTIDKPLATFEAAKAKVREIKAGKTGEIKVAFKAGDYGILDNLTFTSEDSGDDDLTITYCAYGDGPVYFTNGVFIDESEFKSLDENDLKFFSETEVNNIKKVDLSNNPNADFITSFTPLTNSTGFCTVARSPNKENGIDAYYPGFSYFALLPDSPLTYDELVYHTNTDFSAAETDSHIYQDRFYVTRVLKDRLDSYDSYENVQLAGYISKVWHQDVFTITSYDRETGLVTYDGRPPWGFYARVGQQTQIYINNASRELDFEGEYWIDPDTKTLYVYKPNGSYSMSLKNTFATIEKGADHLSFVGLNFRACSGVGIYLYGDNFTMDQCSVMYVGGTQALYSNGTLNIKITNSTFAYCAESAVNIRGPRPGDREDFDYYALKSTGFVFDNNLIHDVDILSVPVESGGLSYGYQIGGQITHNEIYNSGRYGIDFKYGNIDCVMEYNYIHHCMLNSADGGAFYCGRTATNRGNTIRYNLVANIQAANPIHTGGTFAIYIDDGHENLICYGNVFYNSNTIANNNGSRHVIHDNVFILNGGILGKAGMYDISKYTFDEWDEGWNDLRRIPDESTPNGQLWKERWPELYDMLAICKDPSIDVTKLDLYSTPLNYCYNNYTFGSAGHDFSEEWIELSEHENNLELTLEENPIFTDPTHGDYSIREGVDFMDNHFSEIGRY